MFRDLFVILLYKEVYTCSYSNLHTWRTYTPAQIDVQGIRLENIMSFRQMLKMLIICQLKAVLPYIFENRFTRKSY